MTGMEQVPTNPKCWRSTLLGRLRDTTGVQDRFTRNQALRNRSQRQINVLETFIRLLVSVRQVKQLDIIFMQPIFMFDGPGECLPWQIVTLSSDVSGVRSLAGVFVAGHVSCFQMSPYSLWISLTGMVQSSDDELNGTPTSQCDFKISLAMDRLWLCGGITMTKRNSSILCKESSLGRTTETSHWHPLYSRLLVNARQCTNHQCPSPAAQHLSNAITSNKPKTFPPLNTSGMW